MTFTFLDLVGHASFVLTALSFCVRRMFMLRVLAILSGLVGIAYNYLLPSGPLWLVIFWLTVFLIINVVRVVGLVMEQVGVRLTADEAALQALTFPNLTAGELRRLVSVGVWEDAAPGQHLTSQGEEVDGLIVLLRGAADVERDGARVGQVTRGAFIGEISFLHGGSATATVIATAPCRSLRWPKAGLRALLQGDPTLDLAVKTTVGLDLGRKLAPSAQVPAA